MMKNAIWGAVLMVACVTAYPAQANFSMVFGSFKARLDADGLTAGRAADLCPIGRVQDFSASDIAAATSGADLLHI